MSSTGVCTGILWTLPTTTKLLLCCAIMLLMLAGVERPPFLLVCYCYLVGEEGGIWLKPLFYLEGQDQCSTGPVFTTGPGGM